MKKALFENYWNYFADARKKRAELAANLDYVNQVLADGAAKARTLAQKVLKRAQEKLRAGMNPPPQIKLRRRLRLRITAAAETIVRAGHPWLFADSIHEANRAGQLGELAVIFDRKDKFLAIGLFDPDSPIRVRILHTGKPTTIDAAWWQARLDHALVRREGLFDTTTNGYRLIHGESDGWPGLVLDKYDSTLALKIYTATWLPRLEEILALFQRKIPVRPHHSAPEPEHSIARRKTISTARRASFFWFTSRTSPVIFSENGIRFEADVLRGQKTGFFLDQRENRREVETLARGRQMLNAFSFSGGFSVYAARGGAKSVTDLDISAHALESAKRNFALNQNFPGVAACHHETVQADTFDWLENARKNSISLCLIRHRLPNARRNAKAPFAPTNG